MKIDWIGVMEILNSPLELGIRALVLLRRTHPETLDINQLTLMDYCLTHSSDLGGPDSVVPDVPGRGSELALKRETLELGVRLMMRAGMIDLAVTPAGFEYRASEEAQAYLQLLGSAHLSTLIQTSEWVLAEFSDLDEIQIRRRLSAIMGRGSFTSIGGQTRTSENEEGLL
jgi:hypothetical protein